MTEVRGSGRLSLNHFTSGAMVVCSVLQRRVTFDPAGASCSRFWATTTGGLGTLSRWARRSIYGLGTNNVFRVQ